MKKSYVYLLANKNNTVIYVGVTSNLVRRIYEHKTGAFRGFSYRYNCNKLVYFEEYSNMDMAIEREKQIKSGNRRRKEQLVNRGNPNWKDLAIGWLFYID
ncbi:MULTISPECIES: GIY-YIG nuclease family protein [Arenibacter]|uniref:GIY-YIG nuclease family protein n=1 Tax=Arenibacter TaxID=178469 RepID=UPI001C06A095|nr:MULTISPECIES: GIY-YIG nuclease family protein [Arenibacter]MBU2905236.1 GIY-YIG nuclease family protein [Arenibacter algicola]MCK0133044.1 GIY-YIG nuclease family protein [Arenibacter sp. S6351L]